jgi:hypothetical protein
MNHLLRFKVGLQYLSGKLSGGNGRWTSESPNWSQKKKETQISEETVSLVTQTHAEQKAQQALLDPRRNLYI